MVVLQRLDHRSGVEPEDLRQVGAGDPPILPSQDGPLLQVGEEVPGPVDLVLGHELAAEVGDPDHQVPALLDVEQRPRINAAIPMDAEVGVGHLHEGVVLGRLDVPVCRVQHLAGDQRFVDDVGQVDGEVRAAARIQEVHAGGGHDPLVEVGAAPVVPDVVGPERGHGNPENLGAGQLRLGDPDTGLRCGHN